MDGEQSTLDGSGLSVTELDGDGPECGYSDPTTGEACDYYAVVKVEGGGYDVLACPYHAKQSWLDDVGYNDHA